MNKENQSIRDLIFNPMLYTEYPYHWEEQNEAGTTSIIFSKKPRYTLLEQIEIINKIKSLPLTQPFKIEDTKWVSNNDK